MDVFIFTVFSIGNLCKHSGVGGIGNLSKHSGWGGFLYFP